MTPRQWQKMHAEAKRLKEYHKLPACTECDHCQSFHAWLTQIKDDHAWYQCVVRGCGHVTKRPLDAEPEVTAELRRVLA